MRLPNEDELSNLDALHKIASILEEDGAFDEAEFVNDLFLKMSAKKKKKKSGKNVPNNPSLWAECKAWAKRTFDVYPSAYANGAAAKRYKSKGGTWRKADSELNTRLAQVNIVNQSTMYDGQFDTSETETPDTTEDLSDDEVTSLANEIRTLDEEADIELRQHNYSRVSDIISEIETIQNRNPEVADLAKTVLDRLRTFVRVGNEVNQTQKKEKIQIPEGFRANPLQFIKENIFPEYGNQVDIQPQELEKLITYVKNNEPKMLSSYELELYSIWKAAKAANPEASLKTYESANNALYRIMKQLDKESTTPTIGKIDLGQINKKLLNMNLDKQIYNLAIEIARLKANGYYYK